MAKKITAHYPTYEDVVNVAEHELIAIDGVGDVLARTFKKELANNKPLIDKLFANGVTVKVKQTSGGKLSGKSFCLSGGFTGGKKKWQKLIEDNGGELKSSVSKNLEYLVSNDKSGATGKGKKALQLGIMIIDEEELQGMC